MFLLFGVAAVITGFVALCLLFFQATRKTYPGFGYWTAGVGFLALGYLLQALRGQIPLWSTAFLGNCAFSLGMVLHLDGIRRFLDLKPASRLWYALPLAVLAGLGLFYFQWDSANWRGLVVAIALTAVHWTMATLIFRRDVLAQSTFYVAIGSLFSLAGMLIIARAIWLVSAPNSHLLFAAPLEFAFFISFIVLHLGENLSLIMLNAERVERELAEAGDHLAQTVTSLEEALVQQKQTEESLRVSEDRYRAFFETSRDAVFMTRLDGQFLDFNDVALEVFGYGSDDREELLQTNVARLYADPGEREEHASLVARQGFSKEYPLDLRKRNGAIIHALVTTVVRKDPHGNVIGFQGTVRDISESKRATEALAKSRSELHAIYESSPVMMCVVDAERKVVYANRALTEFVGKSESELMDGTACGIFGCINALDDPRGCGYGPHCDSCSLRLVIEDTYETGRSHRAVEYRSTLIGSGYQRDVVLLGSTALIPLDDRSSVLVCLEDVTERKRIEEKLSDSEARLWDLYDNAPNAYFSVGTDGLIRGCNKGAEELLGFPRAMLKGTRVLDLYVEGPEGKEKAAKVLQKFISGELVIDEELQMQKVDGTPIWVSLSVNALRDAEGRVLESRSAVVDITDRKRSEELALQAARLTSVADLSSGVAHHFNNLLQIVMASASLSLADLESGDLSEIKINLEKMLQAATFGAETVKRLQAFASIRADVTEGEPVIFDLATTARNAAEVSTPLWKSDSEKKGMKIDLRLNLEDGCLVKGHENEMFEVLLNLIRNAAEAMPDGGDIEVKMYREANEVIVQVSDTGTGIAEEDLPRVFQPFWSTRGVGIGKGMGLAVTHGLVKRHGGTISIQSKVGAGTSFAIRLPLSQEPVRKTEQPPMSDAGDHMTILVIEDELSIATLLERILERAGHQVFKALSGEEGLAIFEKETVDLVVCDLGMPGMSGWDVGKAIRSICQEKSITKPPFVLLTGWGGQELEKEQIAESGSDAVVSKPINAATVISSIREIAEQRGRSR